MFLIIIRVFQMDINCILMKYYLNVYDHNSCISNGHYLHFNEIFVHVFNHNSWHFMDIICILMKYYFHVYDHNSSISKILYLYFN